MKPGANYYAILNIPQDASSEEIREAYLEAARRFHPDISSDPDANQRFILIKQAYEVLRDASKRAQYDHALLKIMDNSLVDLSVHYSVANVEALDQPQLVYALAEFNCRAGKESAQVPILHICLVLDCSTSMQGERLDLVKTNALQLLRRLRVQDILSVVTFNDRAEKLIVDARGAEHKSAENIISLISARGGTEIFKGLEAGMSLLQPTKGRATRILLLVTDGQTYGDEQACIQLAKQARNENVLIHAAGIGGEWNDVLLDQLAAITGGGTELISRSSDLFQFFQKHIDALERSVARNLKLTAVSDPGCELRAMCRISPDVLVLPLEYPMSLGPLLIGKKTSILFEFLVHPMERRNKTLMLLDGQIDMDLISSSTGNDEIIFRLNRPHASRDEQYSPPQILMDAVSCYTLYTSQERARVELAAGAIDQATKRLQHIATHLLAQGKADVANVVLGEVRNIQQKQGFSQEGDKRVKYGTRALMLPSGLEDG